MQQELPLWVDTVEKAVDEIVVASRSKLLKVAA
jgi:hypothetical protein